MLHPYRHESYDAKYNAQRNLQGRTHYADSDTLKYFHARITQSGCTDSGLIFWLIESVALDPRNSKRGFRYVLFDVAGNVISRVDLENAFRSSEAARKAMYAELNKLDAFKVTAEAIDNKERQYKRDIAAMREKLESIRAAVAA